MRKIGILLGSFAIGLIAVNLVSGQQQPQKKFGGGTGGFGGFGGFGGRGGATSTLTLINNESVKKELEITPEQLEKVPEAVQKALADVLSEKQLTRLRQIELQQRGIGVYNDARVKKELSITAEQSESIDSILKEAVKERSELFKEAKGAGGFQGIQEKMTAIDKDTKEKLQGVLTPAQRKQFRQMLGDEFKLETPNFGGFGNKGKKKKDAE